MDSSEDNASKSQVTTKTVDGLIQRPRSSGRSLAYGFAFAKVNDEGAGRVLPNRKRSANHQTTEEDMPAQKVPRTDNVILRTPPERPDSARGVEANNGQELDEYEEPNRRLMRALATMAKELKIQSQENDELMEMNGRLTRDLKHHDNLQDQLYKLRDFAKGIQTQLVEKSSQLTEEKNSKACLEGQ